MSMLAEPRRRQKWSLNPRGSLWSKDESKFGQKLLEKMGWNSGDGLGVQKQGMTDPITLSANSNTRGLGHKGGDDEVWLTHKDNFDDVLAALNSEHTSGVNSDAEDSSKKEKESLLSASKKAKKRVHYEKRVKGKDISRYTDQDLSCILGTEKSKKRKIDNEEYVRKDQEEKEAALKEEEEAKKAGGDKLASKDSSGLMVIQGGSINDYFKMKMKMLQEKRNSGERKITEEESKPADENDVSKSPSEGVLVEKKKKKKKKDKSRPDESACVNESVEIGSEILPKVDSIASEEKSEKKKKRKRKEASGDDEPEKPNSAAVSPEKKNKRKDKKSPNEDESRSEESKKEIMVESVAPKKNKAESSPVSGEPAENEGKSVQKKKKKRKCKDRIEPSQPAKNEDRVATKMEKKKKLNDGNSKEATESKDRKKKCKARHQETTKKENKFLRKKKKKIEERLMNFAGFNGATIETIEGYKSQKK